MPGLLKVCVGLASSEIISFFTFHSNFSRSPSSSSLEPRLENPRRLRHVFEMWDDAASRRVAAGFVRVGCVGLGDFSPRDFPEDVRRFVERIQALAILQSDGRTELPWT